jgi:hypothetical protein
MKKISSILILIFVVSCTKSKSNNNTVLAALALASSSTTSSTTTVTVPKIMTIVQAALPTALKNTAYSTSIRGIADVQTIQTRIFSSGPADFRFRLTKVDEEITSLTVGTLASTYSSCFTSTGETWNPSTFTVSGVSFSFPMAISCKQVKDANATTYMGADADHYYIANITKNVGTDGIYVLAKIQKLGNTVEIYQLGLSNSGPASILQIIADKSSVSFEVSTASSSDATGSGVTYTGVGCGVQMRTDNTYAYTSGKYTQTSCAASATQECADASQGTTLTTSTACPASIKTFNTKAFTQTILSDSSVKTAITNIGNAVGMPASVRTPTSSN